MIIDIKYIERYWQKVWADERLFVPIGDNKKPKFFNFDSAPFANGKMHLGHLRNYVLGDILARYKRLNGYDVLYTTNFDSFGLPNQLEAEKQSKKPNQYTTECIALIKDDLERLGISYDWSRVNSTSDPKYYRWTQWLFLELHSAGLVYRKKSRVNWCDNCNTVLSNMEVEAGKCNRCGGVVEKKHMPQWFIALSEYSPELYNSIDELNGWSDRAKKLTKGFIGKSTGLLITFLISGKNESIEVFLPEKYKLEDVTFVTAAIDAPGLQDQAGTLQNNGIPAHTLKSIPVSERRRNNQDFTSRVGFDSGIKLIHPISGISIPLYYVNYLSSETGPSIKAGTPVSNLADKIFSEKYEISEINKCSHHQGAESIGVKDKTYYHVHDWVVSRQKKWGTPMPMLECPACGFVPVKKDTLPVINHFDWTSRDIENHICPVCGINAKAVTETLDCYIDDVWCFLSSGLNSKNDFSIDKGHGLDWFPADHYHAGYDIYTYLHLYRFITRFLYKRGYVKTPEPITVYFGHDMVLQDGKKMSKRHNNSKNMRLLVEEYGADVVRVAMLLMANPDKPVRWDKVVLERSRKLVFKVFKLASMLLDLKCINSVTEKSELDVVKKKYLEKISVLLNKEVTNYIDSYRPGSAMQSLEKYTKEFYKIIHHLSADDVSRADYLYLKKYFLTLCVLYSPFAPHMSEEIWHRLGVDGRIAQAKWPAC